MSYLSKWNIFNYSYNLIDNKIINKIKNAHDEFISTFRHIYDKDNKRDLIISISDSNNSFKLWNINKGECIFYIKNIYEGVNLFSACFLKDNNKIYIIASNSVDIQPFKIFNLEGKFIKTINNTNNYVAFIDVYYEGKLSKIYIITGNFDNIQSIDYNENKLYHEYSKGKGYLFLNIIIKNKNEIVKLIGSTCDGYINIFNFNTTELLNIIEINSFNDSFCFCLWDNDYLIVGNNHYEIELINIEGDKKPNKIFSHNYILINIEKIIHPKYGTCLICKDTHGKIFIYNIEEFNNNN